MTAPAGASRQRKPKRGGRVPQAGDGKSQFTSTRGDIPPPQRADVVTASCRVPSTTDITTIHQFTGPSLITQQAAGANTYTNFVFSLNLLDNAAAFANVWDQYRIDAVRVMIKPQNNAINLVTNSATTLVDIYSVIDYDNASNLTSVAVAREYDNCCIQAPAESCVRTFKPRVALAAYTGAFGGFANEEDMWLDCASSSIVHYGLKTLVPGGAAAQTLLQTWEVTAEYWISFKSVF